MWSRVIKANSKLLKIAERAELLDLWLIFIFVLSDFTSLIRFKAHLERSGSIMPLLSIQQLQKSFAQSHILQGIDLDVEQGEVVVILGPSGCGKSTLLRCINGGFRNRFRVGNPFNWLCVG